MLLYTISTSNLFDSDFLEHELAVKTDVIYMDNESRDLILSEAW